MKTKNMAIFLALIISFGMMHIQAEETPATPATVANADAETAQEVTESAPQTVIEKGEQIVRDGIEGIKDVIKNTSISLAGTAGADEETTISQQPSASCEELYHYLVESNYQGGQLTYRTGMYLLKNINQIPAPAAKAFNRALANISADRKNPYAPPANRSKPNPNAASNTYAGVIQYFPLNMGGGCGIASSTASRLLTMVQTPAFQQEVISPLFVWFISQASTDIEARQIFMDWQAYTQQHPFP